MKFTDEELDQQLGKYKFLFHFLTKVIYVSSAVTFIAFISMITMMVLDHFGI